MGEIIGYCRVSTDGQTLNDQIAALKAAGATKIFAEKQSGARSDRPRLRKALSELGRGDVLTVTRLDRLARSTRDLLNVLHGSRRAWRSPQVTGRRMGRHHHPAPTVQIAVPADEDWSKICYQLPQIFW